MEINFGKIELENLINVVYGVKRTECGQYNQWLNINASNVVCGDKEVNKVSFHIEYNMNDRLIHMHAEDWTWNIVWENNDISIDDVTKLLTEKIASIGKDEDGFFVFEKMDEIIEFNKMYKKITKGDNVSYREYIEYVNDYINK